MVKSTGETREKIRFTSKRVKTENGSYYHLTKEGWTDEMMQEYNRWLKNQEPKPYQHEGAIWM
jgi:hypothetical protein